MGKKIKPEDWVKIIEVDGHKILVNKAGLNEEQDAWQVKITACVKGVEFSATLGNKDEARANEIYNTYSAEMARKFLHEIVFPLIK